MKIKEAKDAINKRHFTYNIKKDNEAMVNIKENTKIFFTYVKNKTKSKGKIGPFVKKNGTIINEVLAETLQR